MKVYFLFIFTKFKNLISEVQAFVLNFNGRVDKPSVKNFQLVDANDRMNFFFFKF